MAGVNSAGSNKEEGVDVLGVREPVLGVNVACVSDLKSKSRCVKLRAVDVMRSLLMTIGRHPSAEQRSPKPLPF